MPAPVLNAFTISGDGTTPGPKPVIMQCPNHRLLQQQGQDLLRHKIAMHVMQMNNIRPCVIFCDNATPGPVIQPSFDTEHPVTKNISQEAKGRDAKIDNPLFMVIAFSAAYEY
jgi:hypothetical protein